MRSTIVAITGLLLTAPFVMTSASCADGTSLADGAEGGVCNPGETAGCQGPNNCVGGQICDGTGSSWSSCTCENDAGEIVVDGAFIEVDSAAGGGSGGFSGSGGGGGGADGAGGKGGSGGAGGKGGSDGIGAGGSAGAGGSGGSGSGKGGAGGSAGSGSSGSGGSGGSGGYAYREPPPVERRDAVAMLPGASKTTPFVWHKGSGVGAPVDLWVEAGGKTVLQVSSVASHPFVRAGLDVVPLQADTPYALVVERSDDAIRITLVRSAATDASPVLYTQVMATDRRTADNRPIAEVVIPATGRGSAISVE